MQRHGTKCLTMITHMGSLWGPGGTCAGLAAAEGEGEGKLSMQILGAGDMLAPWLLVASDAVNQASSPPLSLLEARFLCSLRIVVPSIVLHLAPCQLVALSPLIWSYHLLIDRTHQLAPQGCGTPSLQSLQLH